MEPRVGVVEDDTEPCEHYVSKGTCKFGPACRLSHNWTLVRTTSAHSHPLGPDSASKRKKFFCDICGIKGAKGYRCTLGCDFDICLSCLDNSEPKALAATELQSLSSHHEDA